MKLIFNQKINIMYVKGSGWDMSNIDHPGLPAVELDPLLKTIKLKKLNDVNMVNLVRKNLLDSNAPNPSVETLLHSFLPFKYVDHTHADAVLNVTNRPEGLNFCKKIFQNLVSSVTKIISTTNLLIGRSVRTVNPFILFRPFLKQRIIIVIR